MRKVENIAVAMAGAGILIASAAFAYQKISPYLSEQGCIIEGVKNAGHAAPAVLQDCRQRFESYEDVEELISLVISNLNGQASFYQGDLDGTIYNGGSQYHITRLRIAVTDPETVDEDEPTTHRYNVDVDIPPLATRSFNVRVFEEYDGVHWYIDRAWGYEAGK